MLLCAPIVIVAVFHFGPTTTRAETPADRAGVMGAEIDSLRVLGLYSEALEPTRELLALRQGEPKTKPYEMVDAQWMLRTMELAVALPDSVRAELAWADSARLQIEDLYGRGLLPDGISVARRQLEIRRRVLGEEHPDLAQSLGDLGALLGTKGDYVEAEPLYREALAMDRKLLGEDHPRVAMRLGNLGTLLMAKGDCAGAEPLLREALAVYRKLLGEECPEMALSRSNLGTLLMAKGDYAGAEPLFREALTMYRKLLGEEHPNIAVSLNNLGSVLAAKGDYAEAEPLLREALAMQRKLLGEEHPNVALSLNNLSCLLRRKGDNAGAEPPLREALAMQRRLLGPDHPDIALSLGNLGELLRTKEDYAGAEPLLREALAMRRKLLGEEHPDVALSLNSLGLLLRDTGDYAGAERVLREALAMWRKLLGEEHPDVASSLSNLGTLLRAQEDPSEAEAILVQASAVFEAARLRIGPGIARSTFQGSPYPSLAEVHLELGHLAEAWPAAERELGRSLFDLLTTAGQRRISRTEAAREDSLRWRLGSLGRQLDVFRDEAGRNTTGQMAGEVEATRTRILDTEVVWSRFRQEMAAKYPVTEGQAYPLERVQTALDPATALIGWLDVEIRKNEVSRWGYVIRRDDPVTWERLYHPAAKDDIDSSRVVHAPPSLAALFRSALTDSPRVDHGSGGADSAAGVPLAVRSEAQGRALFAERVAPLLSHLSGVRNLVVIPSGEMLGVPVEALPLDDGRPLGERFAVSYAPSATIYTWLREKDRGRRGWDRSAAILLLGDPPFNDAQMREMKEEKRREEAPLSSWTLVSIPDSILQRSAVSGNPEALGKIPRLPASRQEVEGLSKLSRHSTTLLGPDASEQHLVAMARSGELGSYQLIHFATHAWVNPERPEESSLFLSRVDLPDPLEAAEKGERIYDGLVTAKEVLQEWKLDADLVTLSGCQTALGQRIAGEGYIGFAHAFLQAGARSLLVSLWPVQDQATSLLMQRFYGNLFGKLRDDRGGKSDDRTMTKRDALQEAKRWFREYRDEDGNRPYARPFYWASFVLVGDPI
jgi:CHAT domain-containing protein/tetratricopeptide (TPR) repeat protein